MTEIIRERCPFCGEAVDLVYHDLHLRHASFPVIECGRCGLIVTSRRVINRHIIPRPTDGDELIKGWNRRADL